MPHGGISQNAFVILSANPLISHGNVLPCLHPKCKDMNEQEYYRYCGYCKKLFTKHNLIEKHDHNHAPNEKRQQAGEWGINLPPALSPPSKEKSLASKKRRPFSIPCNSQCCTPTHIPHMGQAVEIAPSMYPHTGYANVPPLSRHLTLNNSIPTAAINNPGGAAGKLDAASVIQDSTVTCTAGTCTPTSGPSRRINHNHATINNASGITLGATTKSESKSAPYDVQVSTIGPVQVSNSRGNGLKSSYGRGIQIPDSRTLTTNIPTLAQGFSTAVNKGHVSSEGYEGTCASDEVKLVVLNNVKHFKEANDTKTSGNNTCEREECDALKQWLRLFYTRPPNKSGNEQEWLIEVLTVSDYRNRSFAGEEINKEDSKNEEKQTQGKHGRLP